MGRIILSFLFIIFFTTCYNTLANEDISDVESSQEEFVSEGSAQTLNKVPKRSKENLKKDKMLRSYYKKLGKINTLSIKKDRKTKDIEFLKHRLEVKEQKLEELTSVKSEKGENE